MLKASSTYRSRRVRLSSAFLLLVAFCASCVMVTTDAARGTNLDRPTVGLVNEDLAGEFNGGTYTFGASFVDRISKDSDYNWVVLSRSVAEKAYSDGSVDAILYIPQSFTHDILTLQELAPTKATIEYRLEPQADKRAYRLLESTIVGIVDGFNKSIITMYYASLANNLAEADGQMHGSLSNQKALIAALTSDVQEPFSSALPRIGDFISGATALKGVNDAAVATQNSFTKMATDALAAHSQALTGQLPAIEEYAKRQHEIAQINATNSNKGITDQATSDLSVYGAQFETLKTSMLCALSGLDATSLPNACTLADGTVTPTVYPLITSLTQAIKDYTADHTHAVINLYANLNTRIQNLTNITTLLSAPHEPTNPTDSTDPADTTEPEPTDPDTTDPSSPAVVVDPAIIADLQAEIDALEATRDSLNATLPAPLFDTTVTNLNTWYTDTLARITAVSLGQNTVNSLDVNDWNDYTSGGTGLYIDNSNELNTSINGLINQAVQTGKQIASSATLVPDNTSQFEALLANANATFNGAENVFTGLGALVALGNKGLTENQAYYTNFSSVLANTRTPGVNTSTIYSFLAAPIVAKNITTSPTAATIVTNPVSWLTPSGVGIFGGGLLIGILATLLGGALRRRKRSA